MSAKSVAAVAAAFTAHDFPHGSVEHYARIAVEVVLRDLSDVEELRRLAENLASALRTGEHQARAEALADWEASR